VHVPPESTASKAEGRRARGKELKVGVMSADSIFSVVYLSEGTGSFSSEELHEILAKAREKNSKLDISGMLLFKDGNFLQVLEGNRERVLSLFETIARDPRHHRITILFRGVVPERDFTDWSMGFHDLNSPETKDIPGFNDFLHTKLTSSGFTDSHGAKQLLLLFKEEKLFGSSPRSPGSL
jgi:hypothetical protein